MKKVVSPVSFLQSHPKWLMFLIILVGAVLALSLFLPRSSDPEVDRLIEQIEDLTGTSVDTDGTFDSLEESISAQIISPEPEQKRVFSIDRGAIEFNPEELADALVGQIQRDTDSFSRIMQATFEILDYFFPRIRNEIQIIDPTREEDSDEEISVPEVSFSESIPVDDSLIPILKNLNGADSQVLFHPSGEVLSWGMFYKFLYQKVTGNDSLAMGTEDTVWFQPYERWFRSQYPQMLSYLAADPSDPSVVRRLYAGLPPGVYSVDEPAVATVAPGLLHSAAEDYQTLALQDDSDAYAQQFLAQFQSPEYFSDARGKVVKWPDFLQLLALKEGVTIPDPRSGESSFEPSRRWFQSRYPGVVVPVAEDAVTLSDARFYLEGVLPSGSHGVSSDISSLLQNLRSPSSETIVAGPSEIVDEDILLSFQEFFSSLTEIMKSLVDEDNIVQTEKELRENVDLRADVEELVFGRAPASALKNLPAADQEILDWLQAEPLLPSLAESVETAAAVYGLSLVSEGSDQDALSPGVFDSLNCTYYGEEQNIDDNPLCNP